ncbi:hypothetical protein JCM18902_2411 [Psychrobacter sp. JCM 18902]|uniref:hypothetical protein n=1 Tax=Psychrobacter sp. JCM 18902 TaxID=1298607 RepID=UPI00043518E5|nr:hypothetical protein [Psychrobacter sp. JCM 18902]GAF59545.1 hypothetical protein JCM18902_2411 [Psychrobacter sp. JCM 18902]
MTISDNKNDINESVGLSSNSNNEPLLATDTAKLAKGSLLSHVKWFAIVGVLLLMTIFVSARFFSTIPQTSMVSVHVPVTVATHQINETAADSSQLAKVKNNHNQANVEAKHAQAKNAISYGDFRQEAQNILYREAEASVSRVNLNTASIEPAISHEDFRVEAKNILYREEK